MRLLVGECKNGHVVCEACRVRIHGTCPSCREPVGEIRCRALENAIAGMALPCSLRSHGCTQLLKHTERRDHEAFLCLHAPFACPLHGCAYSGLLLYDHIHDAHTCILDNDISSVGPWRGQNTLLRHMHRRGTICYVEQRFSRGNPGHANAIGAAAL
ncbi:putative E3 ubiquitin-protein ligase SINA-like 6 [Miscanthus floridulus]|uniref:putative E3 ubiquitin-protein ligase SINA-like 6 n=1 Tax=Miscanthus floridulus TaxID=154761 RepID=UPI00345942FA